MIQRVIPILVFASQVFASTYTVTTPLDTVNAKDGELSLREAIVAVNSNLDVDGHCIGKNKIIFKLPSTNASFNGINYYKIKVNYLDPVYKKGKTPTPLPVIRCPVDIDGYSQPFRKGALAATPGSPLIELSGEDLSVGYADATVPSKTPDDEERYASALTFVGRDSLTGKELLRDPSGSVVRGLIINNFPLHAVYLYGVDDTTIVGNFFGLDVSGKMAGFYNGRDLSAIHAGVRLEGANRNFVGTTKSDYVQKKIRSFNRNYFGSNQAVQLSFVDLNARSNGFGQCSTDLYPVGCRFLSLGSSNNVVQGNFFGLDKSGKKTIGGFCGERQPKGKGTCASNDLAIYSAFASVFSQSVPKGTDSGLSTTRGNIIGGPITGQGNVMTGSISEELILELRENTVQGNTIIKNSFLSSP